METAENREAQPAKEQTWTAQQFLKNWVFLTVFGSSDPHERPLLSWAQSRVVPAKALAPEVLPQQI